MTPALIVVLYVAVGAVASRLLATSDWFDTDDDDRVFLGMICLVWPVVAFMWVLWAIGALISYRSD